MSEDVGAMASPGANEQAPAGTAGAVVTPRMEARLAAAWEGALLGWPGVLLCGVASMLGGRQTSPDSQTAGPRLFPEMTTTLRGAFQDALLIRACPSFRGREAG